jgi:hypothetical protein
MCKIQTLLYVKMKLNYFPLKALKLFNICVCFKQYTSIRVLRSN